MPLGRDRRAAHAPHADASGEYCTKTSAAISGLLRHNPSVVQRSDGLVRVHDVVMVSRLNPQEIWKVLRYSQKHGRLRFETVEHELYGDWTRAVEKHTVPVQRELLRTSPYVCLDLHPPREGDRVGATDPALHQLVRRASTGERDASVGWALTWEGHDPHQDRRPAPGHNRDSYSSGSQMSPRAALAAFAATPQAPAGTLGATFLSTAFNGLWTGFAGLEFESGTGIHIRGPEVRS